MRGGTYARLVDRCWRVIELSRGPDGVWRGARPVWGNGQWSLETDGSTFEVEYGDLSMPPVECRLFEATMLNSNPGCDDVVEWRGPALLPLFR